MEKKYRIRKLEWIEKPFILGVGYVAFIGQRFRAIICATRLGYYWSIEFEKERGDYSLVSQQKDDVSNLEEAKSGCEAAWAVFLEEQFLEVAE